jgi:transposase InsO family protein
MSLFVLLLSCWLCHSSKLTDATASAIADSLLEHIINPFGLPWEFLTDCGSNFLSGGLTKFLAAGNIDKANTSGYHPWTNGKNERYNGILEATLFKLNTLGDLLQWEDFLSAALYLTWIHRSDSGKFSPFELVYGVSPRLTNDPVKFVAADPCCPGEEELRNRIQRLNKKRDKALTGVAARSLWNKRAFNSHLPDNPLTFVVGDSVKLRNEAHVKGAPRWYGPFEIKAVLDNNVYVLVDHEANDYSRPVNGNSLRPVSLQSLITNKMWATPPMIALKAWQKDACVANKALLVAKNFKKVTQKKICLNFDGKFITPATGTVA